MAARIRLRREKNLFDVTLEHQSSFFSGSLVFTLTSAPSLEDRPDQSAGERSADE